MAIAKQQMTLDQFLQLPEEEPALEYADGEITQKMSPVLEHGILVGRLTTLINVLGFASRVAIATPEVRTNFGGVSRVPDIAVYRWERIPIDEAGQAVNDPTVYPDIAIEVTSPGQSENALVRKCLRYVQSGVEIALVVDPPDRSVLAFRAGEATVAWRGSDLIDIASVVPGFQLTVDELFGALQFRRRDKD